MVRREGDRDDDFTGQRAPESGGPSQFSFWLKLIVSWAVAGLLAWAAMSNRVASVETKVDALKEALGAAQERATEDRGMLRVSTDRLTIEIGKLREDLAGERLQRVVDRSNDAHATFQRGKQFDK